ncbi:MAG: AIPR family protein [Planctomycetes bacterium]|nr:AIPR family protein [Planctomycetota bacterium]
MHPQVVKQMVKQFRERTAHTGAEQHSFAPWYLHDKLQIHETRAMQQSSDGSYDFGIDAFNLNADGAHPILLLVQAKYSASVALVAKGFRELERALPELQRALEGIETSEPIQNKVLVNLRASLNRLDHAARAQVEIEFHVIHLCEDDEDILANRFREPIKRLSEAVTSLLDSHRCLIKQVAPRDLGPQQTIVVPPEEVQLHLDGGYPFPAGDSSTMYAGVGRLSDLVTLYLARRDNLFSRNVRYYLTSKKNTERGPAGKMRATLKEMCVDGTLPPERFALFHNGITIFARKASIEEGQLRLRDPYVLNGCQTIKNAFLFRHDTHLKAKINDELWKRVSVPLRVIETANEDLVRAITVNNNRQNAMSSAALRANDPIQLRIEHRFKERRILYQRQEGAWEYLWATQPDILEDEFENARGGYVDIHDIARAIVAVSGKVGLANHPNDLFESDTAYENCFDEKRRLRSVVFLVFLQNLHDVMGLVLRKDLKLAPVAGGPRPARLLYHAICLLARYLAREKDVEFVSDWGKQLHGRDKNFREEIRKIMNSNKSGIRSELSRQFMTLESTKADDLNGAFERCKKVLGLKELIDPFATFANLDSEVPVVVEDEPA